MAAGYRRSVRTRTGPCIGQRETPSESTREDAAAPKSREAVQPLPDGREGGGSRLGSAPTERLSRKSRKQRGKLSDRSAKRGAAPSRFSSSSRVSTVKRKLSGPWAQEK